MKKIISINLFIIAALWNLFAESNAPVSPATGQFRHPGLFTSKAELDYIKARVTAREEPWFSAFTALQNSPAGKLDYLPNGGKPLDPPVIHVSFRDASYNVNSTRPWEDSRAAYAQALLWYMTGKEKYAENSAGILKLYAGLTDFSGKEKLDQHILVGSFWCTGFVQAAELLRYTSKNWKESEQKDFAVSLRKFWLPAMKDFSPGFNGNWDTCITVAVMAMGVYLDDHGVFDRAVAYYQKGPETKNQAAEPYWFAQARGRGEITPNGSLPFYLGLNWSPDKKQPGWTQESYRDVSRNSNAHEQGGVHGFVQAAEIAWHQGIDLYGILDNRLLFAVEGTAGRAAEWQKKDPKKSSNVRYSSFYEMAYNHYHNRRGLAMPNVEAVLKLPGYRPEMTRHAYSPNIFGTLTCYEMGKVFNSILTGK